MKTLLVVPEIRLDSKPTIVPFWAGILASIIENKNGQVAILDLNALRMNFGGKQVPNQVIIDEVSSEKWDIIGFSVLDETLMQDIQNIYKGNTFKLNNVNHLYFYNLAGNYSEVSKLLDSKYSKVTALNPLTKLNIINGKKYSLMQGLALAETGNSFRGIDV